LKEARNEEFMSHVSGFNTEVSGVCTRKQRRGSRIKIKILWLFGCRQTNYQDLRQTICTISRVRRTVCPRP
jgi:hypothetical protein